MLKPVDDLRYRTIAMPLAAGDGSYGDLLGGRERRGIQRAIGGGVQTVDGVVYTGRVGCFDIDAVVAELHPHRVTGLRQRLGALAAREGEAQDDRQDDADEGGKAGVQTAFRITAVEWMPTFRTSSTRSPT